MDKFTAETFQEISNISSETLEKFVIYAALLKKWQQKINLVSHSTLPDLWGRHFYDSAQLKNYLPQLSTDQKVIDMGSGAGFPGLVLAIIGVQNIHLIESDLRKTLFLKEVARACALDVTIINQRVEKVDLENVGLITARALKSLDQLLEYAVPFINKDKTTTCLYLKGAKTAEEVVEARNRWAFDLESFCSETDKNAQIIKITNVKKL